jgi:hypothetical protein
MLGLPDITILTYGIVIVVAILAFCIGDSSSIQDLTHDFSNGVGDAVQSAASGATGYFWKRNI